MIAPVIKNSLLRGLLRLRHESRERLEDENDSAGFS